jgi:DNA repair protein RadC
MQNKNNMKNKWFLGEVSIGYRRTDLDESLVKTQIRNSEHAAKFFRGIFPEEVMEHHEEMWIGYLNYHNRPIGFMQLSKGSVNGTVADVKGMVQSALMCNASGVVLMHNHPSGNKTPSDQDIKITGQIKQALNLFDIKLVDHIILTLESYTSMAEEGLMS